MSDTTKDLDIKIPTLGVIRCEYTTEAANPYSEDPEETVIIYSFTHKDRLYEVWLDKGANIVHLGPRAGQDTPAVTITPETRLSVAELRQLAIKGITEVVPKFPEMRSSLHPLEDNRHRTLYFFRWDDFSRPLGDTEMPPFAQMALYADGTIASYTFNLATVGKEM